jgi:TonB family protein
MSITRTPPSDPPPVRPSPPKLEGGELYEAHHWEAAYRRVPFDEIPNFVLQLQDEVDRARRREALWISLLFHVIVIVLLANTTKFARLFPAQPVLVVAPNDWMRQKELTYLELPPDAQKLTRRPNTNVISDKDRIATRKTQLDPKEIQRILDSARRGNPGQRALQAPPAEAARPTPPPGAQVAQQQQQQQQTPPQANRNQYAQAQPAPRPFQTAPMSAGSAIAQAARAAASTRGGYGGDGGDFGLSQGRQGSEAIGQLDVLSDTMGVDFGPYLSRVLHDVRLNWYNLIPEVARAPIMKKGKVSVEFAILKTGEVRGMRLVTTSSDVALDRAAWAGITASNPFPPLPAEFRGEYLQLRFYFYYNPDSNELR